MMLRTNKASRLALFNTATNDSFGDSSVEGNCFLVNLETAVCGISVITHDADSCAAIERREGFCIADGSFRAAVRLPEFEGRS